VREPLAMKLYSPEYLMNELKDENTDLDDVLNAW
jgi:predicted nucleic acid-binding protein